METFIPINSLLVVGKVTADIERYNFNTALAAIMELANTAADFLRPRSPEHRATCEKGLPITTDVAEVIVKMMAPIAPHWAEELWHDVLEHDDSVHDQPWPEFDPEQAKADEVELAVQVNGKVKSKISVAIDEEEGPIKEKALEAVSRALEGLDVKKVIVIKGRLVNIVAK